MTFSNDRWEASVVSVNELVRERAERDPNGLAFRYLVQGDVSGVVETATYAELWARTRAVAADLQQRDVRAQRVILLLPSGLDFIYGFLGCLAAGAIAVPAYLPEHLLTAARGPSDQGLSRLRGIARDSGAVALLTTEGLLAAREKAVALLPELAALSWHAPPTDVASRSAAWKDPEASADAVAFLQYTSGSTGNPKGVVVTHGNVLANCEAIRASTGIGSDDSYVSWLPLFHDMGLIGGVMQPLCMGGTMTLMSPLAFLQRPTRWLKAISHFRATGSCGSNFAFDLVVKRTPEAQRSALDLSCWRRVSNGAEPIDPATVERFVEAFGPVGFSKTAMMPCYGLAESTLAVTFSQRGAYRVLHADAERLARDGVLSPRSPALGGVRSLVSCGRPVNGHRVTICDPETRVARAPGETGEIWVQGPSVTRGYWNAEQSTREAFDGKLEGSSDATPWLRTGDIGVLLEGELFVTGRHKELMIFDGANHFPQDIEASVAAVVEAWKCEGGASLRAERCVAFSELWQGAERLWVAVEAQGELDFEALARALAAAIATQHGLRLYGFAAVEKKTLTRTSSGKPERSSFRQRFLAQRITPLAVVRLGSSAPQSEPGDREALSASSRLEWVAWLRAQVARAAGIAEGSVDIQRPLAAFGLSSKDLVQLSGPLEERAGRPLSPSVLYDFPTIAKLAAHLAGEGTSPSAASPSSRAPLEIAVVGMDCRFPGAADLEQLWQLLRSGEHAVSRVPEARWSAARLNALAEGDADVAARAGWGAFLPDVPELDHAFFGISPRESAAMDPQHKLLLEGAWRALEHAGIAPSAVAGSRTGVFVGISQSDFAQQAAARGSALELYSATGSAASLAANRLSYVLDARGPSLAVDTACSSSLTALALAAEALARGDADLALVGGVNLLLTPELSIAFARARMLSPTGRCHTFDAAADGYVRGEGCGVVVLERLADARRARRRILAVIRGVALGQDGLSNGLTAPNGDAQEAVIRRALYAAQLTPADVDYIEAHGTGTPLGDPIELNALGRVLDVPRERACQVGSIKANLGHLEAAAGIAGFIKAVLMLERAESVPHAGFGHRGSHLSASAQKLEIAREAAAFPARAEPRRVGVSAFGFGGANAHVIVEQAIPSAAEPPGAGQPFILPVAARSPSALATQVERYAAWLEQHPREAMRDVAHTAALGRAHHAARLAVVASDAESAVAALRERLAQSAGTRASPPRVVALLTGQGAQYPGMAAVLHQLDPAFRSALEAACAAADPWLPAPLSQVLLEPSTSQINQTFWAQPALVAYDYAAAKMWEAWGVEPLAYLGHSVGEIAGAVLSGMVSLVDGMRFVCRRAACMQALKTEGGMMALSASGVEACELVAGLDLDIAALNAPHSTVVSGRLAGLEALALRARERGVSVDRLEVSHAFHSELLDPILPALRETEAEIAWRAPQKPLISNLSGSFHAEAPPEPGYFTRHAREPVRFFEGVAALRARFGDDLLFLELGPHPVLTSLVRACIADEGVELLFTERRQKRGTTPALSALARLYERGHSVNWSALSRGGRVVSLPPTPFEHGPKAEPAPLAAPPPRAADDAMLSYYRTLSQRERGRADQDLLNFAPFPEIRPGFSWVKVFCAPQTYPDEVAEIARAHAEFRAFLFEHIDFGSVKRVVDVGCGFAADLIALAGRHPHLKLHGFNISPDQVETGRRRSREAGLDAQIELFCGDSSRDAFHGPYELGLAFQVLHHIVDKAALMRNLSQSLVPGGHAVFAEVLSSSASAIDDAESSAHFTTFDAWSSDLAQAGLRLFDCVDMSVEVANFLHDPAWEQNFAEAASKLDSATRLHLLGPHKLGELLRRGLATYGLLRVVKDPSSTSEALLVANRRAFAQITPYAVARGRATAAPPRTRADARSARFELSGQAFEALSPAQRRDQIEQFVRAQVGKVLGAKPADLITNRPLTELGFDSLMALELKNLLERAFATTLRAELLSRTLSVDDLVQQLLRGIDVSALPSVDAAPAPAPLDFDFASEAVAPTAAQVRFFEQSLTDAHTWNLANPALSVTPRLVPELLRASVEQLVLRHEALRLVPDAESTLRLRPPREAFEVVEIDARELARSAGREAAFRSAAARVHGASAPSGPLLRVALVELGDDEPQLLLIAAHHLLMDAFSFGIFVRECKATYAALARGDKPSLPPATSTYREATRLLNEAVHQPNVRAELGAWQRLLAEPCGKLPRELALGPNDWQSAERARFRAPPERTAALLAAAQRERISVEELLSAALGRVLSRFTGQSRFVIDRVGHGRFSPVSGLDLSRTLGWFNTVFPFVLDGAERIDALELRRQRSAVPDGGVGYSLLRYLGPWASRAALAALPRAELSCNYLGNIDQLWFVGGDASEAADGPAFGLAPYDVLPFHRGPRTERRYLLDVVGSISGESLSIDVSFSRNVHRPATIEQLASDLGAELLAFAP